MANNKSLRTAAKAKKDEFYTQLSDIEKELSHYTAHFDGKTVLCNCDDPFESNFFKYFALNFNRLHLKKLIATSYVSSPIAGREFRVEANGQMAFSIEETAPPCKKPYKAIVTTVHDATGNGGIMMEDVAELFKIHENELTELSGDGDFRSPECLELLDEADIIVTNPPFSLFREYVATLIEHEKKFLIIGNQNAITYKEIFPLLKNNKLWLGYGFSHGNAYFSVPAGAADCYAKGVYDSNTGLVKFRNCFWFTNLDIKKRHEPMDLVERYSPEKYPHYDNYDAIEVSKTADIPEDFAGVMGVPITFLDKYSPEQFEIVGSFNNSHLEDKEELSYVPSVDTPTIINGVEKMWNGPVVNKKPLYKRICIRNKHPKEK